MLRNKWAHVVGIGGRILRNAQWAWDVAFKPSDLQDIITKYTKAAVAELVGQ